MENPFRGEVDEKFCLASVPKRSLAGAALEELSRLPESLGGSELSCEKAARLFDDTGVACIRLPSPEARTSCIQCSNVAT